MSKSDLTAFYKDENPNISNSLINWRVRTLTEKGILERIGHGVYQFGEGIIFTPDLKDVQKRLYKALDKKFPYAEVCIWSTSILNGFMVHQPAYYMTILEVDREIQQNVFNVLREHKSEVFLEMDVDIIDKYRSGNKEIVVVKPLITEAPTQTIDGVQTVTLEKVLADIYCDRKLLQSFQGSERATIFKEAFTQYTVNQDKLLRYAGRRGKRKEISAYLKKLDLLIVNGRGNKR